MGICALRPQSFLIEMFRQEQPLAMEKLRQQAGDGSRTLRQFLEILSAIVSECTTLVSETPQGE